MTTLTVGSAISRRGEKVSGRIVVPDGVDPGSEIPVTVIAGMRDGPILALVAGIHGSEPSPILGLQRVREAIDASTLAGTVIIVQIANLPSFVHRTIYRGPWDQKNLNRVFPGRPDGTASERIAHAITTQVIDRCDFLIDMHSGDGNEALRPYAYWNLLGLDDAVDARARDLALAFGLDHLVIDRGRSRDTNASVTCANTAHVRGKPAVTTEVGSVGVPTEAMVAMNAEGAMRVLRYLSMQPGPREMVSHPCWIEPSAVLYSPATGLWHAAVGPDEQVTRGQRLGHLTDYFGATIAEVVSPMAGLITYVVVSPSMTEGEPLAMVGQVTRGTA